MSQAKPIELPAQTWFDADDLAGLMECSADTVNRRINALIASGDLRILVHTRRRLLRRDQVPSLIEFHQKVTWKG